MKHPATMGIGASRTRLSGILFEIVRDEFGGSGSARPLGHSILTGGDPLDAARRNVRGAIDSHFDEAMQRPSVTRLPFECDEAVLA